MHPDLTANEKILGSESELLYPTEYLAPRLLTDLDGRETSSSTCRRGMKRRMPCALMKISQGGEAVQSCWNHSEVSGAGRERFGKPPVGFNLKTAKTK